jgi:nucleotide-binding universal stress UspA family protein
MFEQILVPLDRSVIAECVLPHALTIAQALNARLLLLHVVTRDDRQNGLRPVDPLEWHIRHAEAENYLQGVRERVQEAGLAADIQVLDGDPAEQILATAHDQNVGLVALSSHGQSGLSRWNISSVVQKVIMGAHTSLLIVRAFQLGPAEPAPFAYRRLLAPLDSSIRAESSLPLTSMLARACEAEVLLVHVVQRPAMPRRMPLSSEDSELAERVVERNRCEAEAYLENVRSQLPGVKTETRLLVAASPSAALHELAEHEEVDLLILSAHGDSGQLRWPYGSLVTSFITYGATPLLIFQDALSEQIAATHAQLAVERAGRR